MKSSAHRMEMYKKISLIRTPEDARDVYDELCDRFGNLPRATERLIDVALVKALAECVGISRVECRQGGLSLRAENPDFALFAEAISGMRGVMMRANPPSVTYKLHYGDEPIVKAKELLLACYKTKNDSKEDKNE